MKPTDKPVETITKCHFNRGGKQPSAKKFGAFGGQPNDGRSLNVGTKLHFVLCVCVDVLYISGREV